MDWRHRVGAAVVLSALAIGLVAGPCWAQTRAAVNPAFEASSSDQARRHALAAIAQLPLEAPQRAEVESVLHNVSVFRRMPIRMIDCDPDLYSFLLGHPDVIVNIWEALGVTQLQVRQMPDGRYHVADNAGIRGTLEVLYQGPELRLAYAEGYYEGPLSLRKTRGRALVMIRSDYLREGPGRCFITTRMDCFLNLEPGATELITKILQPVVGGVADNNFVQTVAFLGSLSRTAEVNARGVERLSAKLENVQPDLRRQLALIAERIAVTAQTAPASAASEPPVAVAEQDATANRR